MTATNRELAEQAQQIARRSEGLERAAANCVMVALTYSPSVKVAREALQEVDKPDVRRAALELLESACHSAGRVTRG